MTRGKRLSPDLRRAIYHMSFHASADSISESTDISVRTIYRIIKEGKAGEDFAPKIRAKTISYKLTELDIQVCYILSFSH
jgi:hypothetical protein